MINRDLIRRKIVQLTYAYYQNSDHNMDNAEKELMFSLSKSYDLYNYMLQLIVAITQEARKRYDVDVAHHVSHSISSLCSSKRTRCCSNG